MGDKVSNYEHYMKLAIEEARNGEKQGEPPFGGILIDSDDNIVAKAHDTVKMDNDMSSHSETNLVRIASKKIGPDLSGCKVICTTEPCPMCFTAMWLAKIDMVVFGTYISDVLKITSGIQRELNIPAEVMNEKSGNSITLVKEVMRDACLELCNNYYQKFSNIRRSHE